AKSFSKPR
nr:Chain D, ALA-LYS-SER-PHE-SER-LYS-PRO-ARG [Homo sapiens]